MTGSLRKQPSFRDPTTGYPAKLSLKNDCRDSILMTYGKFVSSNQTLYPDLGSDTSSTWNFYARSSDVVFLGNKWWRGKMSGVFSGFLTGGC